MNRLLLISTALLPLLYHGVLPACTVMKGMPFTGCTEVNVAHTKKGVLEISSNTSEYGVIAGANVVKGGSLQLFGMSMGDISVGNGAKLVVKGSVSGVVTNQGGSIEIEGTVSTVIANSGTTIISGNVNVLKGDGKIELKKGAFVNGRPIK